MVRGRQFRAWGEALVLILAASAVGCGASSSDVAAGGDRCTPGQQVACACPGGFPGAQACTADGNGYERCDCGSSDAGPSDAALDASANVDASHEASLDDASDASIGSEAAVEASADASIDASVDAHEVDASEASAPDAFNDAAGDAAADAVDDVSSDAQGDAPNDGTSQDAGDAAAFSDASDAADAVDASEAASPPPPVCTLPGACVVTTEVPTTTTVTTSGLVTITTTVCPNGPRPNASPPECVLETDLGGLGALAQADAATCGAFSAQGDAKFRVQSLPVHLASALLNVDFYVTFGVGACGAPVAFAPATTSVSGSVASSASAAYLGCDPVTVASIDVSAASVAGSQTLCGSAVLASYWNLLRGSISGAVAPLLRAAVLDAARDRACLAVVDGGAPVTPAPCAPPSCAAGAGCVLDGDCASGTCTCGACAP